MRSHTRPRVVQQMYPHWFYLPAAIVFVLFFLVPTALAFYFSLTRWSLFDATFIGLDNYRTFVTDPQLLSGLRNTIIYAVMTSGLKVVIALPLAMLLTSSIKLKGLFRGIIFFPVLVSTVAVGITFATLMQPSIGLINTALRFLGLPAPDWLGHVNWKRAASPRVLAAVRKMNMNGTTNMMPNTKRATTSTHMPDKNFLAFIAQAPAC